MLRYLMSYPKINFRFIQPDHAIPNRINGNISKKFHAIWKILFILGSYEFLACLECISRNGLYFGHLDWDLSSVVYSGRVPNKQTGRLLENETNPTYLLFIIFEILQSVSLVGSSGTDLLINKSMVWNIW